MALSELIAALEKATGPSRELDAAIFAAVYPENVPSPIVERGYGWRFTGQMWWLETGEDSRTPRNMVTPPAFTASIDAALTLVPEGYKHWNIGGSPTQGFAGQGLYGACIDDTYYGEAATPALAICIAALKARGDHD